MRNARAAELSGKEPLTSNAPSEKSPPQTPAAEALLHLWLASAEGISAQQLLSQLITEHADPVIREIVRHQFRTTGSNITASDAEDVRSETLMYLLKYLRQMKATSSPRTPENFRSYVATIAHHRCAEYLRQRYPQRRRLKDQLRYLLTRQPGLSLWTGEGEAGLCGFSAWQVQNRKPAERSRIEALRNDPQPLRLSEPAIADFQSVNLTQLLTAVFNYLDGPIELTALLSLVAALKGISDHPTVSISEAEGLEPAEKLSADIRNATEKQFNQRLFLHELWVSICQLPLPNRAALLLNLRDGDNKGLVMLLADLRIASWRRIAEVLAMTPEQFASIWQELPLDDTRIAAHLGITRQQVINLRKAARKWLTRQINAPPEKR